MDTSQTTEIRPPKLLEFCLQLARGGTATRVKSPIRACQLRPATKSDAARERFLMTKQDTSCEKCGKHSHKASPMSSA